ncbi:hypothetical protein HGRIS_001445 [Hohenbuehelia grisea]|uniref:Uncharacterized protein n=1 Tax=Hohenbuehelia grisea TaxID=104357 RepID=A0ABR3JPD3_9AGAR
MDGVCSGLNYAQTAPSSSPAGSRSGPSQSQTRHPVAVDTLGCTKAYHQKSHQRQVPDAAMGCTHACNTLRQALPPGTPVLENKNTNVNPPNSPFHPNVALTLASSPTTMSSSQHSPTYPHSHSHHGMWLLALPLKAPPSTRKATSLHGCAVRCGLLPLTMTICVGAGAREGQRTTPSRGMLYGSGARADVGVSVGCWTSLALMSRCFERKGVGEHQL